VLVGPKIITGGLKVGDLSTGYPCMAVGQYGLKFGTCLTCGKVERESDVVDAPVGAECHPDSFTCGTPRRWNVGAAVLLIVADCTAFRVQLHQLYDTINYVYVCPKSHVNLPRTKPKQKQKNNEEK